MRVILPDLSCERPRVRRHLNILELQPTINASRRKAREAFLIYGGKTLSPEGINRKNER